MILPPAFMEWLLFPKGLVPGHYAPRRHHVFAVVFWPLYALFFGWMAVTAPAEPPPMGLWSSLAMICVGVMFAMSSGGFLLRGRSEALARWLWVLAALIGSIIPALIGMAIGGRWLAVAGALAAIFLLLVENVLNRRRWQGGAQGGASSDGCRP